MADKTMFETTERELRLVKVPTETRTYKPVEHGRLIDITQEAIQKSGFILDGSKYTWARNGNQSNARYTISNVADNEMQLQIGWQNSFDKSLSLKFAIGARIFICSNGSVCGDMGAFKKKHVGKIQEFTPHAISEYISQAGEHFQRLQRDREKMKQIEMTKRTTSELLGRMFIEQEIITATQLGIIKKELDTPTFDYGADDSLWQIYNFTTFSYKSIIPSLWIKTHMNLHNFILKEYNLQD